MNVSSCLLMIFFSLLFVVPCLSAELTGHVKSLNLYQDAGADTDHDIWLSANTLRFDLNGKMTALRASWQLSLEQLFLYQDPAGSIPLPGRGVNRIDDLTWNSRSGHPFSGQSQVDRLNLRWTLEDTVITVGRQGIGFGRISLFSPLDVIAPFSPTALDTEVRPGVDAVRAQYYFGVVGEAGAVLVTGDGIAQSSALANLTVNAGRTDFLLIGGQLRDRSMAGFGVAGSVLGAGWKVEWAGYHGNEHDDDGDPAEKFSIAGCELEYLFPADLLLQVQYLYNGPGSTDPQVYPKVARSAPLREGLTYLYAKHYLLTGMSWDVTPLVRSSALFILNLDDDSSLLRPLLDISLADNCSLEIFFNIHSGDKPSLLAGIPVPRSEFGSIGDGGGFLLKVYF